MSRKFDEKADNTFELFGIEYSLVDPSNFSDLAKAIKTRDALITRISELMHDEDSSSYEEMLNTQTEYIDDFIVSIGEFSNRQLMKNINRMLSKYDISISDFEKALGVSAGYISRTAKENAGKKLSIDIVWKIARLFNVDVEKLIEEPIGVADPNTDLILRFLDKLRKETSEGAVEWECLGGGTCFMDKDYEKLEFFKKKDMTFDYVPSHLNSELAWSLDGDIYACKQIDKNKSLVIIPYTTYDDRFLYGYDFVFTWFEKDGIKWKKAFYTIDDRNFEIRDAAEKLYKLIEEMSLDSKVTPDVKTILENFLD